ncbi:MAG: rod-binding protein [Spirochaetales bacterium]|jgi:flagellar protein FlgJ|nr:rod-binding protein [Spirochaetales bacterium]
MSITIDSAMLSYNESRFGALANAERKLKGGEAELKKLRQAGEDFEAIFIKQMLDAMRKTLPKGGLIDGGMAEEIFEDLLYEERAKIMAKTGSLGIADMIYNQYKDRVAAQFPADAARN